GLDLRHRGLRRWGSAATGPVATSCPRWPVCDRSCRVWGRYIAPIATSSPNRRISVLLVAIGAIRRPRSKQSERERSESRPAAPGGSLPAGRDGDPRLGLEALRASDDAVDRVQGVVNDLSIGRGHGLQLLLAPGLPHLLGDLASEALQGGPPLLAVAGHVN